MTLKQHAALVGVTPAYLSALEHGHRGVPTPDMVDRIIATLELETAEIERVRDVLAVSHPRVTLDTAGLQPMATEAANLLAERIRTMTKAELTRLMSLLRLADPRNKGHTGVNGDNKIGGSLTS